MQKQQVRDHRIHLNSPYCQLLLVTNEGSDTPTHYHYHTDSEAMLHTIHQLLCSVVHLTGDIEEGVLMNQLSHIRAAIIEQVVLKQMIMLC